MTEFLSMGGHGVYIWSSYGVAFLLLFGVFCEGKFRHKRLRRELDILRAGRPRRAAKEIKNNKDTQS